MKQLTVHKRKDLLQVAIKLLSIARVHARLTRAQHGRRCLRPHIQRTVVRCRPLACRVRPSAPRRIQVARQVTHKHAESACVPRCRCGALGNSRGAVGGAAHSRATQRHLRRVGHRLHVCVARVQTAATATVVGAAWGGGRQRALRTPALIYLAAHTECHPYVGTSGPNFRDRVCESP